MNRSLVTSCAALLLSGLLLAAPAHARWQNHPGANVRFELPDNWAVSTNGNVLVTRPALPGLGLEFVAITGGRDQARITERLMLAAVGRLLQNARITGRPRPVAQNGLRGLVINGTGERNGQPVLWFSVAVGGQGRGVLALGFATPDQFAAHRPTIVRIFNSIQPMQ